MNLFRIIKDVHDITKLTTTICFLSWRVKCLRISDNLDILYSQSAIYKQVIYCQVEGVSRVHFYLSQQNFYDTLVSPDI